MPRNARTGHQLTCPATIATKKGRDRLRPEVARLLAQGLSERAIADRLGTSRTTVWTIKQEIKAAAR